MKEEIPIKDLTEKQRIVLDFIKKYQSIYGYTPTIREIGASLGLSSPATVHSYLKRLANHGYIRLVANKFRAMELLVHNEYINSPDDVIKIPLLGKTDNPHDEELIAIPSYLVPKNQLVFALKVNDNSMKNIGIYEGDIVLAIKQNTATNKDIVVATINDKKLTLKTFYKESKHIRLQPENNEIEPIILDKVTILGKAIGLYRKL